MCNTVHFVFHPCEGYLCKERIRLWMLINILRVMFLLGLENRSYLLDMRVIFFTCGCNHQSTNWDMGSIMLLQLDTIGLIPIGFL